MWSERLLFIGIALVSFKLQSIHSKSDACFEDPFLKGRCRKYLIRWSYNLQWETCAPFAFGGCGGNENKFATKQDCEAACVENARSLIESDSYFPLKNKTDEWDSDQDALENLPERCLDEMVHMAPKRKTINCKVDYIDDAIQSSKAKLGWTFDATRSTCKSRPYLEAACADTKNKFITSSECRRVCESKANQGYEQGGETKFWKKFKKHSYKNNFKLREKTSDWISSCSDHPVWVVDKLRKSWMEPLSNYGLTQMGYSYNQLKKECVKVKDIVKSPTLNKFFTKSECTKCKVLRLETKPTCLLEPKIAPEGLCNVNEIVEEVDDDHLIDDIDEEQNLRKRRRRRRRNQLLRNKIDRSIPDPEVEKVWSFFDGKCKMYSPDSCISTRNSFRSKNDCKHKCSAHISGTKNLSSRHQKPYKNLYFYHPDQQNFNGVFFFYLPAHYKLMDQVEVNRRKSRKRIGPKRRSELANGAEINEDDSRTPTVRASWSMYDDRDREVVIKEMKALKAKLSKKATPVKTTTNPPPADEEFVDAIEETTRRPITTTMRFKPKLPSIKMTRSTQSLKFDTTTERALEKLSIRPHPRCSKVPPPFGMCKRGTTKVWSFIGLQCEEHHHNLCSVKFETNNIFRSKADCLKTCRPFETVIEPLKPNSPVAIKPGKNDDDSLKTVCNAAPTRKLKCPSPEAFSKVEGTKQKGRLSFISEDAYKNYEANRQVGQVYPVDEGEIINQKVQDEIKILRESNSFENFGLKRFNDASHESPEGRLIDSVEDMARLRSSNVDDSDISLARSADNDEVVAERSGDLEGSDFTVTGRSDDLEDAETNAAGRSFDLGDSEISGRSWYIENVADDFPEGRNADEDRDEPLAETRAVESKRDEEPLDKSSEKDQDRPEGRSSTNLEVSDYPDEKPKERRADEESDDGNDERQIGRTYNSQESAQRKKRSSAVDFQSGYVYQNGKCKKLTLMPGECFAKSKNFFANLDECATACIHEETKWKQGNNEVL